MEQGLDGSQDDGDQGVSSSNNSQSSSSNKSEEVEIFEEEKDEESFPHSPLVPPNPYIIHDPPLALPFISNHGDGTDNDLLEQVLFFGCGLGSSLCYIATLSSLVFFTIVYGPDSYVDLNLAVYLPLLPISLAQAKWDQRVDQYFYSRLTFFVRLVAGFGLNLTGTIRMMVHSSRGNGSLFMLILDATFQGIGGAILYGTFNQMASFVGRDDGRRLKAAVSAGVQASALVVLAASLGTKFGIDHEAKQFSSFLWIIVVIEIVCFAMCLLLLTRSMVAISMTRRDRSIREENLLSQNATYEIEETFLSNSLASYAEIWGHSKRCCCILVVNLVPSFLVGSWFTQVETNWIALAQVLFYVRIASDLLGRLATIVIPHQSIQVLTWIAGLRLFPVLLFFINSRGLIPFLCGDCGSYNSDIFSIILVAVIAFLSGYLVTGCYQLAPQGLPSDLRDANLAKQASLLTVAFSVAAVGGLLSSFILVSVGL